MDSLTGQQVFIITSSIAVIAGSFFLSRNLSQDTVPGKSVVLATLGTVTTVIAGCFILTKAQENIILGVNYGTRTR